jgi:hypothetical protein
MNSLWKQDPPSPNGASHHEDTKLNLPIEQIRKGVQAAAKQVDQLQAPNIPATKRELGNSEFYAYYESLLNESEIKLSDEVQEPVTCLEIVSTQGAVTFGTLGNFLCIIGKAKSRKTYLLSAMVAALIKQGEVMGIRGRLPVDKRKILYFDTEQLKGHVYRVLKRVSLLSDDETLSQIKVYGLRRYNPTDRLNAIRVAIEREINMGAIIIDGIKDLVFDINDAKEATDRATDLLQWTEEKDAHLITIIHENKANGNARGHLGSELVNKAETVISVGRDTEDKDVSVVAAEYCRDREFEPFGFSIGEDGLPYTVDGLSISQITGIKARKPTVDTMKTGDIEAIVRRAFFSDTSLHYAQLRTNVIEASKFIGVSLAKSRAEEFIRRVEATGYVTKIKLPSGRYESYKPNPDKLPQQLS